MLITPDQGHIMLNHWVWPGNFRDVKAA